MSSEQFEDYFEIEAKRKKQKKSDLKDMQMRFLQGLLGFIGIVCLTIALGIALK